MKKDKNNLPSEDWDKYHHKVGAVVLAVCLVLMIIAGIAINIIKNKDNKNDTGDTNTEYLESNVRILKSRRHCYEMCTESAFLESLLNYDNKI